MQILVVDRHTGTVPKGHHVEVGAVVHRVFVVVGHDQAECRHVRVKHQFGGVGNKPRLNHIRSRVVDSCQVAVDQSFQIVEERSIQVLNDKKFVYTLILSSTKSS